MRGRVLVAVALALLPAVAAAEIILPPGFTYRVYVSGEGFDTDASRGARGIPAASTMAFDSAGNLYCCGPGGIHVFAPDATSLGVIRTPENAANFCWGDADLLSLFITASTSVYRARVKVPGRPQLG